MRLARLTGLEMEKLEQELAEIRASIEELEEILGSRDRRMGIIVEELEGLAEKYGDDRRTEILPGGVILSEEDLIVEEDMVITVSRQGYVKRIEVDTYRAQRTRRPGPEGNGDEGGGLGRAPLCGLHPRLPHDLHPVRAVLSGSRSGRFPWVAATPGANPS